MYKKSSLLSPGYFLWFLVKTCGGGAEEWRRTLIFSYLLRHAMMTAILSMPFQASKTMLNSSDQWVYLPSYRIHVLLRPVEKGAKPKIFLKATCAKRMLGPSNQLRTARGGEPSKTLRAQFAFAGMMQMKLEHPDREPHEWKSWKFLKLVLASKNCA